MSDRMTAEQRHRCMSSIRANDTQPEMIVRRFLWSHGFRYRLHRRRLPGTPDIVLSRLHAVIFINGCFWHGHECQKSFPRTNRQFWLDKINRNRIRDFENGIALRNMGWSVLTIWECELKKSVRDDTLRRLLATLRSFETVLADKPRMRPRPYSLPDSVPQRIAAEPLPEL